MAKEYQLVLPMDRNDTVKNQFGWLPLSVYKPGKGKEWDQFIQDDGDPAGTRRSQGAKYLPGLRFSRFNPELAEKVIRYWSLEDSVILDPFSGRSTRAVVATQLKRHYVGYEIVPQVAKRTQEMSGATIHIADGCLMDQTPDNSADLVFTCPPYHRLERYEVIEGQLSEIKPYDQFLVSIARAAGNIFRVMKPGAFLCWVCADWRDGKAFRLFHRDSLQIFEETGLMTHDIVIIHNNSPFAPLQAGKVAAKRYTSKVHEYLLVFRKSDA